MKHICIVLLLRCPVRCASEMIFKTGKEARRSLKRVKSMICKSSFSASSTSNQYESNTACLTQRACFAKRRHFRGFVHSSWCRSVVSVKIAILFQYKSWAVESRILLLCTRNYTTPRETDSFKSENSPRSGLGP